MIRGLADVHVVREIHPPRYGRRVRLPALEGEGRIANTQDAVRVLKNLGILSPVEHFVCIFLDNRQSPFGFSAWPGAVGEVAVYPQNVFRQALLACAAMIVVGHNHPSGDPSPSSLDQNLTDQLVVAGSALSIPILDHVIVSDERYFSFDAWGRIADARQRYTRFREAM